MEYIFKEGVMVGLVAETAQDCMILNRYFGQNRILTPTGKKGGDEVLHKNTWEKRREKYGPKGHSGKPMKRIDFNGWKGKHRIQCPVEGCGRKVKGLKLHMRAAHPSFQANQGEFTMNAPTQSRTLSVLHG